MRAEGEKKGSSDGFDSEKMMKVSSMEGWKISHSVQSPPILPPVPLQ
jgi:hypothetical protein